MSDATGRDITEELKAVGVKTVGLIAPESKVLSRALSDDEKIMGVVYGKYSGGLAWLVATNLRIIFIDRKLFFSTTDELSYDVVAGIKLNSAGAFCSVILHTRMGDYTITYANPKSAAIFVKYIENRRLEELSGKTVHESVIPVFRNTDISEPAIKFLNSHDLAVLSTVDRTGNVYGAVVNYAIDQDNYIYVLTNTSTNKSRNVISHHQVALTVHEQGSLETVQLSGSVEIESTQAIKDKVYEKIMQPRDYKQGKQLPPVAKLKEGSYMIMKITPEIVSYHDYSSND